MVAASTLSEYFGAYTGGGTDEVIDLIKSIVALPIGARLYGRSSGMRQWTYSQSTSYTQYFTLEVNPTEGELRIAVMGGWRTYADGISEVSNGLKISFADYRTSKEAVEAICRKFVERYQKPASQGNVKVFYDESKFMWCWKRPNSQSFCVDSITGDKYHADTCLSIVSIQGNGVVPDERRFLGNAERVLINGGQHTDITVLAGQYHFKSGLVPLYRNQIPFNQVHTYIPRNQTHLYEFVMVNNERVYLNLKKAENSLLQTPIHSYSTRIEALVPASKLFLKGKYDLYAKRDNDETPFLGWELEACTNQGIVTREAAATTFKEHLPWLIMCKLDGSITPEGFETVSVPATLDFWKESSLSSALDSMRIAPYNMRSYEHSKCGFHVHVSRSALSVLDLQKLERFVHNPDNNDFITKIAGRKAGEYQRYSPDLFNNRKKWLNPSGAEVTNGPRRSMSGRFEDEDILFFTSSWERLHSNAVNSLLLSGPTTPMRKRLRLFGLYLNDYVSFQSLDQILYASPLIRERYPNYPHTYTLGDIVRDYGRNPAVYLPRLVNSESVDEQNAVLQFFFEKVLCVGRPKWSALVKKFFPEWDIEVPEEQPEEQSGNNEQAWKAGVKKSAAPYKRSQSKVASQLIKGPVGKGVNQRYDALNTTNANTVEFRMFKGTMNGTTIMRYLEFVDALVRFVGYTNATNEGLHFTAFINWLRSDSFNIVRYEHLVSFITSCGFIDRKEIRRKTLPTIVSEDKNVTGLVASLAKGFEESHSNRPIGSFILTTNDLEEEAPAVDPEVANEAYDSIGSEYEEEYYEDDDPCDCEDCRANIDENGNIVDIL